MPSDEYKALTYINLPFIEERFAPGAMIPYDRLVASAEQAAALVDNRDGNVPTADEMIADLIENGSLSDDPEADLHPESLIPDPNRPTLASIVAQAQALIDHLEAGGADVPAKLRALAEISERQITSADAGEGGESGATNG